MNMQARIQAAMDNAVASGNSMETAATVVPIPVNAAGNIRGANLDIEPSDFDTLFSDAAESLVVNVWNIRSIKSLLSNQKNLQFKITNDSGGNSDITFAYMRVV